MNKITSLNEYVGTQIEKCYKTNNSFTSKDVVNVLNNNLEKGLITKELYDKAIVQLDNLIEKAKYRRREGGPGKYKYFYGDEGDKNKKRGKPTSKDVGEAISITGKYLASYKNNPKNYDADMASTLRMRAEKIGKEYGMSNEKIDEAISVSRKAHESENSGKGILEDKTSKVKPGDIKINGKKITEDNTTIYNGKRYKKQPNDKWLEVSEMGLTKKEHLNESYLHKIGSQKENLHYNIQDKLSDKEYTDKEVGLGGKESIYEKLKKVDNDKFTKGFGFITKVGDKKIGFLTYNSGGQDNLKASESLNLSNLKNLEGIVDSSTILHLQAHYHDKAEKITKTQMSAKDIDMVIITDHNVHSKEVFKQDKIKKSFDECIDILKSK